MLKSFLRRVINKFTFPIENRLVKQDLHLKFMLGQLLVKQQKESKHITSINDAEFQVYSQWGDDGIIQYLINKIPNLPKIFIEFGVETYTESNTRFLLMNNNWKGLVIDGSQENINYIKNDDIYWRYSLTARCEFVTKENINNILKEEDITGKIGLLHIDIDGNDYWIWKNINIIDPAIVIVEYNAVFGPKAEVTIPYSADFYRTTAHHSNLYWGCSIKALIELGKEKGYTFIGCNQNGNNAYFIKSTVVSLLDIDLSQSKFNNSNFRESRGIKGNLNYITGKDRLKVIEEMDVFDLKKQKSIKIKEILNY